MGVIEGCCWFQTGDLEDRVIFDVMDVVVWPKGRHHERFVLIPSLEVCQEWEYFEDIEGSWQETWRTGSSLMSWMTLFDPESLQNIMSLAQLEVCQEPSFLNGGTWRMMMVPERRLQGQVHQWCYVLPCFTPRKIPVKFHVDIFIRSLSIMVGPSWGYLEDIDGSWQKNLRTGSSLMSWMTLFDPKKDTLIVSCWCLH